MASNAGWVEVPRSADVCGLVDRAGYLLGLISWNPPLGMPDCEAPALHLLSASKRLAVVRGSVGVLKIKQQAF